MNVEAAFLLDVLRNTAVDTPPSIDWNRLLLLAETHGVLPVFCSNYPGILSELIIKSFRRDWASSAFLAGELELILALFSRHDIDVLPLKGPVLAEALYGSVSLRTSDDLDLLVRPSDFPRAESLLLAEGFLPEDVAGNYHRGFLRNDAFVELHFAVASPSLPLFDLEGAWARASNVDFRGHKTQIFAKPDLVLYLILHGIKHHFARLIWLLDVAHALKGLTEEEACQLQRMAHSIGVEGALLTTCELARSVFLVDLPAVIRDQIAINPAVSAQASTIGESVLSGPAHQGTPPQNAALFVQLEQDARSRWTHRLRFLLPTPQDHLWAHQHGIASRWLPYLRPLRLLFRYGPSVALRTLFPAPPPKAKPKHDDE